MKLSPDNAEEYEKLMRRLNSPRIIMDNELHESATVLQVNRNKNHGSLVKVVEAIADLNLIVRKAHIFSDGRWFMDVFKVTNQEGNKIASKEVIGYIENIVAPLTSLSSMGLKPSISSSGETRVELLGRDRPGLLSELSAAFTSLGCDVVNAELWTHNNRAAAVFHIVDLETSRPISDPIRQSTIKKVLHGVLRCVDDGSAKVAVLMYSHGEITHSARRLHQIMYEDRDYEHLENNNNIVNNGLILPRVEINEWVFYDYSVVKIRSKDRPKLVFDTICTLTDMDYVVFHANIDAEGPEAYLEYFIKHKDGSPLKSYAERQRLIKCLRASITRRVFASELDLKLELRTRDRIGLLSDVTRILRENGVNLTRAQVVTNKDTSIVDTFYIRDVSGGAMDPKTVASIRQAIGQIILQINGNQELDLEPNIITEASSEETGFLSKFVAKVIGWVGRVLDNVLRILETFSLSS